MVLPIGGSGTFVAVQGLETGVVVVEMMVDSGGCGRDGRCGRSASYDASCYGGRGSNISCDDCCGDDGYNDGQKCSR